MTAKTKIAICASKNSENELVADRFARCDYYSVYNHDDLSFKFVENNAKEEMSGAGGKAAKQISSLDIDVVLVPEVGPKAYQALEAFGIEIFQYKKTMTVRDAIYAYYQNELTEITAPSKVGKHA